MFYDRYIILSLFSSLCLVACDDSDNQNSIEEHQERTYTRKSNAKRQLNSDSNVNSNKLLPSVSKGETEASFSMKIPSQSIGDIRGDKLLMEELLGNILAEYSEFPEIRDRYIAEVLGLNADWMSEKDVLSLIDKFARGRGKGLAYSMVVGNYSTDMNKLESFVFYIAGIKKDRRMFDDALRKVTLDEISNKALASSIAKAAKLISDKKNNE